MNFKQMTRSLWPIDIRSIWRDDLMALMLGLPVLLALVLRWGLPSLTARLLERYGFDLSPYTPVVLAFFFVEMCPLIFAFLTAFLLLDERDDQTLTALQVTPLTMTTYLAYRIFLPILFSVLVMFLVFPLSNLVDISMRDLLLTGMAAAPTAPMIALLIASTAKNKVQGFALMKVTGQLLLVPVISFFVGPGWELLFGILPTYWPMKVYWMLQAGEPGVWPYFVVAVAYQSVLTALFARRFNRVLHR